MGRRKPVKRALPESAEWLRAVIDGAYDSFIAIDAEGRVVEWNPQAATTFGWARQEALGRSVAELLIPPRYRQAHQDGLRRFLATGEGPVLNRRIEINALHRDGREFPVELAITPIQREGEYLFSVFLHDITARKQVEEELAKRAQELARSNADLKQFAYVAAHDLQEPLRKIQSFGKRLQMVCGETLGSQERDYLERMQSAAGRMQALIDGLLAYSQVTTDAQSWTPVDLGEIAREVVADLELQIERSGGRVEVGELPTVDADPVQMRQLLQNLIGNGLKFHLPDTVPLVKLYGRPAGTRQPGPGETPPDGEGCEIVVEDNGIGFDQQEGERIFELFHRLHGRSEYEGVGVGLAICRKIAERHGGTIAAQGNPGSGARFTITFPPARPAGERTD